jgi:hypothetical protein
VQPRDLEMSLEFKLFVDVSGLVMGLYFIVRRSAVARHLVEWNKRWGVTTPVSRAELTALMIGAGMIIFSLVGLGMTLIALR